MKQEGKGINGLIINASMKNIKERQKQGNPE
jgi:hypothetical protein